MTDHTATGHNPVFVEARLDEPLRSVRQRLLALQDPGGAYLLIHIQPGQFGLISGYNLRRYVNLFEREQNLGPGILDVTLRQLQDHFRRQLNGQDILASQPGTERSGLSQQQMAAEARRYGRVLLLLEGGQPSGVYDETIPGIVVSGYDLLDRPIPMTELERTPVVVATYDTSVATALDRLRTLRGERSPFVLFPDPRRPERWFAFAEKDLRQAVEQKPAVQGWALAHLRDFNPRECRAVAYEEIGRRQAEEILREQRCLVVLREGQPRLLVSEKVLRGGVEKGPAGYDLPTAGPAGGGPIPETVPVEPGARYVNLWFEEAARPGLAVPLRSPYGAGSPPPTPVARDRPLLYARSYNLWVQIGTHNPRSIVAWEKEVRPPPIVEPPETREQKEARFYVSLFTEDFDVEPPTRSLTLPPGGDSEAVPFKVRPLRRTFGAKDLATLDMCLYYRCNLVQSFRVEVEVLAEGEEPHTTRPQNARVTAARVEEYPELDQVTPKELCLTITRRAESGYRFTFTLAPEAVQDPRWGEISLGCQVDLRREDLTHLITKARRQLYNVVRVYDLIQQRDSHDGPTALRALAQVGRQLYRKLFATQEATTLAAWMEENLPPGSALQIVDRAGDFVFPWSLVYTEKPWDEEKPVDVKRFWGWRYRLAISTETLISTYGQAGEQIQVPEDLKIMVGLYGRLKGAREQLNYFRQLDSSLGRRVRPAVVEDRSGAIGALKEGDHHLVYFFCHGYTEKMAADIQPADDLVGEFTQLAADRLEQQDQAVREHLEDLFDVSDSWLRLTRGKLPLTMLQEEMEGVTFRGHPLVFLNMCQSAQVLPSLSGGLIPFFIEKGARAVVGTECSMNMLFGDRFARDFLDRFLHGEAAGTVLWQLRQERLNAGDPLALAYTLFGDTDFRLAEPVLHAPIQEGPSNAHPGPAEAG